MIFTSLRRSTIYARKMAILSDFLLKMRNICAQLNRTGRIYDVIAHPEVHFNPYLIPGLVHLLANKQRSFKTFQTFNYLFSKQMLLQ